MIFFNKPDTLPTAQNALAGRDAALQIEANHFVNGAALKGPYPQASETIYLALGCFWGAERLFWALDGVHVTAVGYQGGVTPNPTYSETCTGKTGHTESVQIIFDPAIIALDQLLKIFWEAHDPTQGMRQGNDRGSQYRSAIYWTNEAQAQKVRASFAAYQTALDKINGPTITTEIEPADTFYYAETDHQQYLAKNPGGYCNLAGTGVTCPLPAPAG